MTQLNLSKRITIRLTPQQNSTYRSNPEHYLKQIRELLSDNGISTDDKKEKELS